MTYNDIKSNSSINIIIVIKDINKYIFILSFITINIKKRLNNVKEIIDIKCKNKEYGINKIKI